MNPDFCGYEGPSREEQRLRREWEAYYLSRGMSRFRASGFARSKAYKGKRPPQN
jgi:hypothetical protein